MILEYMNTIALYLICIFTSLAGCIAFFITKGKEEPITTIELIGISFLSFSISIILGTTFFDLDIKTILVFSYFVFALGIFIIYKKKITNQNLTLIISSLSLVVMLLPVDMINETFNLSSKNIISFISIFSIIPVLLLVLIKQRFKNDNLRNKYDNIVSLTILGLVTVVFIPKDFILIVSSTLILFPVGFAITIMKAESKKSVLVLESKLNALEKEFHYELRKELNKRTFHLKEVQEKMSHINKIDNLTKAYNKKAIFNVIEDLVSNRKIEQFSVIMFDLDKFKILNDTLGHVQGDLCLRTLSNIAFESIRDSDFFGRFGGDEFLIVLPNANLQTALTIAERFRVSVDKNTKPHFTVSVGLASYPNDGNSLKELLDIADKGLYLSKEKGRNSISYHNPDLDKKI